MLTKLLIFILILSSLNILRHGYFLSQAWVSKNKYKITNESLIKLGASIAYVATIILSGL